MVLSSLIKVGVSDSSKIILGELMLRKGSLYGDLIGDVRIECFFLIKLLLGDYIRDCIGDNEFELDQLRLE
jgi:hypothetical protein